MGEDAGQEGEPAICCWEEVRRQELFLQQNSEEDGDCSKVGSATVKERKKGRGIRLKGRKGLLYRRRVDFNLLQAGSGYEKGGT